MSAENSTMNPIYSPAVATTVPSASAAKKTSTTAAKTASGISGQDGQVPSPSKREHSMTMNAMQIQDLFKAIKEIMPEGTEDTDVLLMRIADSLKETQSKLQAIGIEAATSSRKADLKELDKKQQDIEAARVKAEKKRKTANIFSKICNWFSAVASIITGAVLVATGNPAGAALLALGIVMVGNEISKEASGKSMFGHMGMGESAEMYLMMGLAIAASVGTIGVGIFNAVKTAASTAATVATTATSTATTAASATSTAASTAANVARTATTVARSWAQIGTTALGAGEAVMTGVSAGVSYDASTTQASVQEKAAGIKQFEALMEALSEFIERAIKQYIGIEQAVENLKDSAFEAVKNKQALTMSIKLSV